MNAKVRRAETSIVGFCSSLFIQNCKIRNIPELKVQRSALSVAGGRMFGRMKVWISYEF